MKFYLNEEMYELSDKYVELLAGFLSKQWASPYKDVYEFLITRELENGYIYLKDEQNVSFCKNLLKQQNIDGVVENILK